ncbi:MAG: hypothetical protein CMP10_07080 [Zetaproteobacteria bacterium]|nr:hypothetical protein [Pseudobdellovibrionaceae bacterium]
MDNGPGINSNLIYCTDDNFVTEINDLFSRANNKGLVHVVDQVDDAKSLFYADETITNLVFNGLDFPNREIYKILHKLSAIFFSRDKVRCLIYLSDEQYLILHNRLKSNLSMRLFFYPYPLNQASIDRVFAHTSDSETESYAATKVLSEDVTFQETWLHLKETLSALKALEEDRSNLEAIGKIGQRFNGIFGAFAYEKEKQGYLELSNLAHIIDDIARHYNSEFHQEIDEEHFRLMLVAAESSFSMISTLKQGHHLGPEHIKVYQSIKDEFDQHTEIGRRTENKQEEVDALLADLGL